MRALHTFLASVLGIAVAVAAPAATVYRWVDAQGVVHYSDTPHEGAATVDVQDAQGYAAPAGSSPASGPAANNPPAAPPLVCAIVAPSDQQTFFAPDSVHIDVSLDPGPAPGDQVQVSVDGVALSPAGSQATGFDLPAPARGTHTVTLAVRDAGGQARCTAAPVTFFVQQPSELSPQSPLRSPLTPRVQ